MAMNKVAQKGGLTDVELDRFAEFLSRSDQAMNIEEVDGFFAALIAGPEVVLPSEYLPEVFGGEMADACEFSGLKEANEILGLIMGHWNGIAATLHKGDVHLPILLEDGNGVFPGNDWARGFVRGMDMRSTGWAELLADEEQSGSVFPMLMLYHEHDEDPELRPGPIGPEKREDIIVWMVAGVVRAYRYFRAHRQRATTPFSNEPHRSAKKIARNDPCPCGSGRKYKRCCGGVTIQ